MGSVVGFFEFMDSDVRVDLGRLQVFVAKHGLDVAHVGPAFQHQRGHGVAEKMAGATLAKRRPLDMLTHQAR